MKPSELAIVALGSNLGDSREILRQAMEKLKALSAGSFRQSSIIQTEPVDCPPGSPSFLNAVAVFIPRLGETPESLLSKLQEIESGLGRTRGIIRNAARTLDLDLIAFATECRARPELTLPHPRAHLRRFVLQPLSEIVPDLILPGQTKTVRELLKSLPENHG